MEDDGICPAWFTDVTVLVNENSVGALCLLSICKSEFYISFEFSVDQNVVDSPFGDVVQAL